jgi:hypothetical protein
LGSEMLTAVEAAKEAAAVKNHEGKKAVAAV